MKLAPSSYDLRLKSLPVGRLLDSGIVDPLARFKAAVLSGTPGTIFADGDSNTLIALEFWAIITEEITTPGGEWPGWTVINGGQNGQTLEGQLSSGGMSAIYASAAKLVLASWLTNDARLARSVAQMTADLQTYVANLKANLPGADILLCTPNSWQLTDPQGYGYVDPLSAAQQRNDNMWQAYENVRLTAPANVAFFDRMTVTGKTLVAVNPLNRDILHWNNEGQSLCTVAMMPMATPTKPAINLASSAAAWASNPNNPWTVYARALEDTRYCLPVRDLKITDKGGGYAYFFPRYSNPAAISPGDFIAGDFISLPLGVYTVMGWEGQAPNSNGINMYGINDANFPSVSIPSNGILYRKI